MTAGAGVRIRSTMKDHGWRLSAEAAARRTTAEGSFRARRANVRDTPRAPSRSSAVIAASRTNGSSSSSAVRSADDASGCFMRPSAPIKARRIMGGSRCSALAIRGIRASGKPASATTAHCLRAGSAVIWTSASTAASACGPLLAIRASASTADWLTASSSSAPAVHDRRLTLSSVLRAAASPSMAASRRVESGARSPDRSARTARSSDAEPRPRSAAPASSS